MSILRSRLYCRGPYWACSKVMFFFGVMLLACTADAQGTNNSNISCSGDYDNSIHPCASVPEGHDFVQVVGREYHSAAVRADGTVACWSDWPWKDPCGVGSGGITGTDYIQVDGGDNHTLLLKSDGSLSCIGEAPPWQFPCDDVPAGNDFIQVSSKVYFSLALRADGSIECWNYDPVCNYVPVVDVENPFIEVSAGGNFALALRQDGSVICWPATHHNCRDAPDSNETGFVQVAAGDYHGLALRTNGTMACWVGASDGIGDDQCIAPQVSLVQVSAGGMHSLGLLADGSVVCWGYVGYYDDDGCNLPPDPARNDFIQVSAGRWHNLALSLPGYTPASEDPVTVSPMDESTGQAPVTVTFESVTESGMTTLVTTTGTPPPTNFKLGNPPTYFDIETTATFAGLIQICIDYSGITFSNEQNLRLIHVGDQGPVDITDQGYPDVENDIICGTTTSLSPFLIGEPTIVCPSEPVAVGPVTCSYPLFYTPTPGDSVWDWGDNMTSLGVIDGDIIGYNNYDEPGVYSILLSFGQEIIDTYQYLVVYDPDGGFVTGGGWIESPEGAYVPDPDLTGKATFGFVSKYRRRATVPDGNTEFHFQAADLNFHSSNYEWLIISGQNRARFKGVGTVNGAGEYRFMVWAVDDDNDTFRIKIWTEDEITAAEEVLYDNGFDQEISGGNIVVHKR